MVYLLSALCFLLIILVVQTVKMRKSNAQKFEGNFAMLDRDALISHAREIAKSHEVERGRDSIGYLIDRMNNNYRYVSAVYLRLSESAKEKETGDAEWLLDNFYIIEEQIKDIRQNMQKKYFSNLPVLKQGYLAGLPRVFALALELVSHTGNVLTTERLIEFIQAYQEISHLTDIELWSVSTMLKIAILENIRQICQQIIRNLNQKKKAHLAAKEMCRNSKGFEGIVDSYFKPQVSEASAFFETLCADLAGCTDGAKGIAIIDEKLIKVNATRHGIIDIEHQKQASRQMLMGNMITSLRFVLASDFSDIFKSLSFVEKTLDRDPAGVYQQMDKKSKDFYRKQVEVIAQRTGLSEAEVASCAVEFAENGADERERHVGQYLITTHLDKKVSKCAARMFYALSCAMLTAIISYGMYLASGSWILFILSILPASDITINLINYIVTHNAKPVFIPRLELRDGIPAESATLCVIAALMSSEKDAISLANKLETYYLSNRHENICYGILGDLADSDLEFVSTDSDILAAAEREINLLNEKYGVNFYLFCRARRYNPKSGKFMGWERKRGALVELCALLRGEKDTSFNKVMGDVPRVKYVITLDADTHLGRNVAKELVGAMSHPINRPIVDMELGRVVGGYGLMQPRINVDIVAANKSRFAQIMAGQGGLDVYSGAISDIYQDLFGEGIFTGKGIFDVDIFNEILPRAIPENTVLSHDLLEGCFIRCGLISDVSFIDGFPFRYNSYAARAHRWIRGDWQLLPWLFGQGGLSGISRWKIFDNLRRSIVPIFLAAIVFLAFNVLPGNSLVWVGFSVLALFFNLLISTMEWTFSAGYRYVGQKNHASIIFGIKAVIYQAAFMFAVLPYSAYLALDAAWRTIWRVVFSQRNMLEWVTAADSERKLKNGIVSSYYKMWFSVVFAAVLVLGAQKYIATAAILGAVWALAPLLTYCVSLPIIEKRPNVLLEDERMLRNLARRTWQYFEDFVTAKSNWLPPDNFQENPPNGVAMRTSPTNIGLHLLSLLAAYDFGFITADKLLDRLERGIGSVEKLDKWKGHLYNWYELRTLNVMRPRYISSVDSGNFVGYMITLKEGLKDLHGKPTLTPELAKGLRDIAGLAEVDIGDVDIEAWTDILDIVDAQAAGPWQKAAKKCVWDYRNAKPDEFVDDVRLDALIGRIEAIVDETDFSHLLDPKRELFSIGYSIEDEQLTKSYYDLFASEARQASYIAIARGQVPKKHWFRLGRTLVARDGYRGLVSWTGTMFEYLMTLLIIGNVPNTLLDETYHFTMRLQQKYGRIRGVPWGASESGYNAFDINLNYQYKAFGVPDLGLKRGLGSDMVVAPYATILGLMVDYDASMDNIGRLMELDILGRYGFYEAIDYTPEHIMPNEEYSVVKSYMVHHLGMSMLALDNVLGGNVMQKRFGRDVHMKTGAELLAERVPTNVVTSKENHEKVVPLEKIEHEETSCVRSISEIDINNPEVHALSNSRYSTVLTDSGLGYSKFEDAFISRWRGDLQSGIYGNFIFIENITKGGWWTNTLAPGFDKNSRYNVVFSPEKAEFFRTGDDNISAATKVIISPEDNSEIRQISIANHSDEDIVLEVTSYQEVVLTELQNDVAHPAFSNLFVRTEYMQDIDAVWAERRQRHENENVVSVIHAAIVQGEACASEFETDRAKFIGRRNDITYPDAITKGLQLSGTQGAVVDPCIALKKRITIAPGKVTHMAFITAFCESREEAVTLVQKYMSFENIERVFEIAWTRSRIERKYLGIGEREERIAFRILPHLLYLLTSREKLKEHIEKNTLSREGLWAMGISGDNPIVTLRVSDASRLALVGELLAAHELWRIKGIKVDLVLFCEDNGSYMMPLTNSVRDVVSVSHARDLRERSGGVYVIAGDSIDRDMRELLFASSRVVLMAGDIEAQLDITADKKLPVRKKFSKQEYPDIPFVDDRELEFYNGFGGFAEDEYVICTKDILPAPWINVMANEKFGFIISESGGGYVWSENSRQNKLTPWSNDVVSDMPGEMVFFRDEVNGEVWTPMASADVVRHGLGYTEFNHVKLGIETKMTLYVPKDDKIKINRIKITNKTDEPRQIMLTYYIEPVLDAFPHESRSNIRTSVKNDTILISNNMNRDYADRVAFAAASGSVFSYTGDRREFFGGARGKNLPECLMREGLSGRVGAGLEPCAAIQMKITIQPHKTHEIALLFGQEVGEERALELAQKYKNLKTCENKLDEVKDFWRKTAGGMIVKTPDRAFDMLVNGRLIYQTLACRIWGRSAFYQSGGAYGFRDQLQDVVSMLTTNPELAREHIVAACAHQFEEGDVQHWWHKSPERENITSTDNGVRTRCSDDLLWLPYVVLEYLDVTGDVSILDVMVNFVEDKHLDDGCDERYSRPRWSTESGTVYEHCRRAVERSLRFGEHGLPLIGSCDWNDGMSKVGNLGRGESVWLGWFMCDVLTRFAKVCCDRGDDGLKYEEISVEIARNIEENAWDGGWYRRAYFDDGSPLGSAQNTECRIDLIAQAWAAISGAGDEERANQAMNSVLQHLVCREDGTIRLLTPPFDSGELNPGYIKGYLPGVRENGGQYTHAAAWAVLGLVMLGKGDAAFDLFSLINPINHTRTQIEVAKYKTEPYAVAADVYSGQNGGRGGWTWYTGAAGWMYRVAIEGILGIKKRGDTLTVNPCIPNGWKEFEVKYRYEDTAYIIKVKRGEANGVNTIQLVNDGRIHEVEVVIP